MRIDEWILCPLHELVCGGMHLKCLDDRIASQKSRPDANRDRVRHKRANGRKNARTGPCSRRSAGLTSCRPCPSGGSLASACRRRSRRGVRDARYHHARYRRQCCGSAAGPSGRCNSRSCRCRKCCCRREAVGLLRLSRGVARLLELCRLIGGHIHGATVRTIHRGSAGSRAGRIETSSRVRPGIVRIVRICAIGDIGWIRRRIGCCWIQQTIQRFNRRGRPIEQ